MEITDLSPSLTLLSIPSEVRQLIFQHVINEFEVDCCSCHFYEIQFRALKAKSRQSTHRQHRPIPLYQRANLGLALKLTCHLFNEELRNFTFPKPIATFCNFGCLSRWLGETREHQKAILGEIAVLGTIYPGEKRAPTDASTVCLLVNHYLAELEMYWRTTALTSCSHQGHSEGFAKVKLGFLVGEARQIRALRRSTDPSKKYPTSSNENFEQEEFKREEGFILATAANDITRRNDNYKILEEIDIAVARAMGERLSLDSSETVSD